MIKIRKNSKNLNSQKNFVLESQSKRKIETVCYVDDDMH